MMLKENFNFYFSLFLLVFLGIPLLSFLFLYLRKRKRGVEEDTSLGHSFLIQYKWREGWVQFLTPIEYFFLRYKIPPNVLTFLGLLLSFLCAIAIAQGFISLGGFFLILAAVCDIFDGRIARLTNKVSCKGALLDSVLDRIGEFVILCGFLLYFLNKGVYLKANLELYVMLVLIFSSFMTSYLRARAESLGIPAKVGWIQRPERIAVLIIGSCLSPFFVMIPLFHEWSFMLIVLDLLALASLITVLQRTLYILKRTDIMET
ncbi:MAG: CDP-alcohol phosphatidyltransferase family protein [Deltaproteobacteria bacterium]|nr:CDP-alcohol phosphatidyltransferase family protein [Deltaproteobacteria bacterium]